MVDTKQVNHIVLAMPDRTPALAKSSCKFTHHDITNLPFADSSSYNYLYGKAKTDTFQCWMINVRAVFFFVSN